MLPHYPGGEVLHHYITYFDQILKHWHSPRLVHVYSNAQLITNSTMEPRVSIWVSIQIIGAKPHGVYAIPCLYLYHLGSQVA